MQYSLAGVYVVLACLAVRADAGRCFSSTVSPDQGLCRGTFTIKVCATNQTAADSFVQESHGIIVKGNCKKALSILCGDVGGGEPTDDLESICCRVADHCSSDSECEGVEDPHQVPMCCDYCQEIYGLACKSSKPVHSGFTSITSLFEAFYISEVKQKCAGGGRSGNAPPCRQERGPGAPCLKASPTDSHQVRRTVHHHLTPQEHVRKEGDQGPSLTSYGVLSVVVVVIIGMLWVRA